MAAETGAVTDGIIWGQLEPLGRWRIHFGWGVFVTSGTTVVVYCPFDTVAAVSVTPITVSTAAAAANGQLTVQGTVNSTTKLLAVSSNSLTISRIAGTDSALQFFYICIGR